MSNIRKDTYRSNVQVTFELYGLFFQIVTGPLFQINLHLISIVLVSVFKIPHNSWDSLTKAAQYLVNFTGLVGIVNATIYKTKPIFTGLEQDKLS